MNPQSSINTPLGVTSIYLAKTHTSNGEHAWSLNHTHMIYYEARVLDQKKRNSIVASQESLDLPIPPSKLVDLWRIEGEAPIYIFTEPFFISPSFT